jgi:hypothetical protein
MTPDEIERRKQAGLRVEQQDLEWLLDLVETLAKAIRQVGPLEDFSCALCGGQEDAHAPRCALGLADAALAGRWRITGGRGAP